MTLCKTTILFASLLVNGICLSQQKVFTLLKPDDTNIHFNNEIKETGQQNVLAYEYFYNGGGVAAGDINNDGLPDLFFTGNTIANKLYLNLGNCKFKDITKQSGTAGRKGWKTGVTMADVNGDGLLDIYVCYSGKGDAANRKNQLFINKGNLVFSEEAKQYGLDDESCSTQAVFFDYDIDGDLDMYLLNHNIKAYKNVELHHLKTEYDPLAADKLYRNDEGHFTDVSIQAGISGNPISFGLGIAVSDINNDGWPDIYVSNDYTEQDYLYINNGNGTFTAREHYMLSHLSQFSMGSDIADINNDGLVDIFTLDMLPEDNRRQKLLQSQENYELYQQMATNGFHYQFMRNMLHLNNGNGAFSEIAQVAGISNTDWSWSALFADFDNDGNKDLFITNGYMRDYTNKDFLKYWGDYLVKQVVNRDSINYLEIVQMMPSTMISNYAFRNNGRLHFDNTTHDWGLEQVSLSNGAAYADLDNDGDLDLVVNNINAPAFIYRNELMQQQKKNYISVQFKGAGKNTLGIGAKLYCYSNGSMQFYEQMPVRGYQSSVSEVVHIGLGDAKIDSLKVVWLNGQMQVLKDVAVNSTVVLDQKDAKTSFLYSNTKSPAIFTPVRSLIDYQHLQLEYNDFKRQPLMPAMQSQCGPVMVKADVNGDGLDDIIIGSSQGQGDALYLQQDGKFVAMQVTDLIADSNTNTTSVLAIDVDGDKDVDLFMTSGGYNDYDERDDRLRDRLFINDGKGNFRLATDALPVIDGSKSCAAATDVDGDGDVDLFIGSKTIPGRYPESTESNLLLNDGKGKFTLSMKLPGMITDAAFEDINKDGKPDLVIVGEWAAPKIFFNNAGKLQEAESLMQKGLWNTIELVDVDNDGDKDIIAGNWGLNSQLHASAKEPVELVCKDFDDNGSIDPILCFYIQGKSYPYVSRDELLDQLYSMRRKFTSYKSYADATLTDMFTPDELNNAMKLQATELETIIFLNDNGKFTPKKLPVEAQFAPVYKILTVDANADGATDILLLGNNDYPRLKLGKMDANFGTLLLNDGKGNFRYVPQAASGLRIAGDVKDAMMLTVAGQKYLVAGINNNACATYKLNVKAVQKDDAAANLSKQVFALTEVMYHDVVNPPAAARFYSYCMLTAYEILSQFDGQLPAFQRNFKGYPAPSSKPGEKVDKNFAVFYGLLETGRNILPSGHLLDDDQQQLVAEYASVLSKDVMDSSMSYAKKISKAIIQYSRQDGYFKLSTLKRYSIGGKDSTWRPTPPEYMAAVEPNWRTIRTFFLDSPRQFHCIPATPFNANKTSSFYKLANEVYETGNKLNDEQKLIANYWDCNPFAVQYAGHMSVGLKKISPGGHWMSITGIAARQANLDLARSTLLYTLVACSLHDAFIVCWDEKFRSNRLRPETAINAYIDEKWKPLLQTPPFPEYTSGHSVISTATAEILTHFLRDNFSFTDTTETYIGMPSRKFSSFRQAADEACISRLYGGIHFRDAIENGREQGLRIAEFILKKTAVR